MADLAEFLLARIAEDKEVAGGSLPPRKWAYKAYGNRLGGQVLGISEDWRGTGFQQVSEHIARHDPARVLAECEAKRRIVESHEDAGKSWSRSGGIEHACSMCGTADEYPVEWPCLTLRLLALPYADHPDYDQSWRP